MTKSEVNQIGITYHVTTRIHVVELVEFSIRKATETMLETVQENGKRALTEVMQLHQIPYIWHWAGYSDFQL